MSLFKKIFGVHRKHSAGRNRTRPSVGSSESLESRCMLAGDVAAIAGDSNLDGAFDSSDFVQVFTAGKFETGKSATFAEGDWNGDGFFNSGDMVKAFQDGHYNKRLLAADALDGDAGEDGDGQVDADGQVDGDVMDGDVDDDGDHHRHRGDNGRATPEERIQRAIENVQERIDGGLPDGVDTEAVQAAVNAAAEALGNGDLDAAKEALKGLRDQFGRRNDADRPSPEDRIQRVIDRIQERIDGGLPEGVDVDAVQAAVNAAAEALGNGDLDAAKESLKGLRGQLGGRGDLERPSVEERIQSMIDRLQTAITEGTLPEGVDAAAAQAAIDAATAALANSDIDAAKEALAALRGIIGGGRNDNGRGHGRHDGDHGNDHGGDTDADRIERITSIIQGMIDRLQTAITEDRLPEGIDAATVQAAIDAAAAALEAGDIDAARDALSGLRGGRGDHGNGGGEGGDDGDDADGDGRGNGRGPRG